MDGADGMKRLSLFLGQLLLSALVGAGVLAATVLVPQVSLDLGRRYSEFSNQQSQIQLLLTLPILISIAVFLVVMHLQRLVHRDHMFSPSVYKWVRLIVVGALGLAGSFVVLIVWLTYRQALAPFFFLTLVALSVFCLAVAAVTSSLLGLLRRATLTSEELEGVV